MSNCLTIKLTPETSGCLLENPACTHARKLGFSFICCHPDHTRFHAHVNGVISSEALQRYNRLKLRRRNDFIAALDEESREFFCR